MGFIGRQEIGRSYTNGTPARCGLFTGLCVIACSLHGQTLLNHAGGRVITFGGDAVILDTKDPRKDIPCSVTPQKPELGFDMKFHSGYDVSIPMRELNGGSDLLTMIFRVTPDGQPDEPIYFSQKIEVPKLDENASGQAFLSGGFDLGEGNYQVDWLMRDRSERICSAYWSTSASLAAKERGIQLSIKPNVADEPDLHPFREEPPVSRDPASPLNVKILINFAPQKALAASLQPLDMAALVSILRNISREPRIGKFSVIAFNMQEQRVLYRQDLADQIDFPALGNSLLSLKLGTVHVSKLEQKHADTEFLTQLLQTEMAKDHPDGLILAGPKVMMEEAVTGDSIRALGEDLNFPVFYMNYNLYPQANPWRDAIGNVVKKLRGYEYTISRPHDLWNAWTEIMSHIVNLRMTKLATLPNGTR